VALQGRRLAAVLIALAFVYTGMNAAKPLHVDDPFTYYVSRQIVAAPLDPFGFDIYWYQWPQPAHEDLLAPVVAYWGALGLAVSGTSVVAWKLWLFPFALLFVWSLHRLARRFAPGLETWLVAATLFGPAFLPSFNYMQDVPAIALGLAALSLYLDAADRRSLRLAIAAGLVAGLAMQTKWTQLTIPAAMLLYGVLAQRLRLAIAACAAAGLVFVGWEAAMTLRYGHGMLLFQLGFPFFWTPRTEMILPLVHLLGALLAVPALLGLAALGAPRWAVAGLGVAIAAGWSSLWAWPVETALYLISGVACVATGVALAVALLRRRESGAWLAAHRTEVFLVLWLAGEVTTYFVISYFPAVRRVLMTVLVATLLAGRAGSLALGRRALPLGPLLALQVALGLAVWSVDLLEARAQRQLAEQSVQRIRAHDPGAAIWYVGHWGFQYYAEAAGMQPLIPDHTLVRRGDWLVVPARVDQQEILLSRSVFERAGNVVLDSRVPLTSLPEFYVGYRPLQRLGEPRASAALYRANADGIPESAWPLSQVAEWAISAGGDQANWAAPALVHGLERAPEAADRMLAARALEALGPLATKRAAGAIAALERAFAEDPIPAVRAAAGQALARIRAGGAIR
jgi:hypothetical protein